MDLGLAGRTAIVCGALGRHRARLRGGARQPRARTSPCSPAAASSWNARPSGSARWPSRGDVTNPKTSQQLVEKALEAFGGIDVLVVNSGGPPRTSAFEVTDEQVEEAVELLLLSAIRLVRLCRPHLEASGRGRVIAITSSAVKEPIDTLALSNAIRPGLVGWLKTISRELGPEGVTVNSIAPGRIDTERIKEVYPDGPTRGGPRHDPAAPARHAARGRRRRLLPRLRPRRLRDGRDDRRGRRADAGHVL